MPNVEPVPFPSFYLYSGWATSWRGRKGPAQHVELWEAPSTQYKSDNSLDDTEFVQLIDRLCVPESRQPPERHQPGSRESPFLPKRQPSSREVSLVLTLSLSHNEYEPQKVPFETSTEEGSALSALKSCISHQCPSFNSVSKLGKSVRWKPFGRVSAHSSFNAFNRVHPVHVSLGRPTPECRSMLAVILAGGPSKIESRDNGGRPCTAGHLYTSTRTATLLQCEPVSSSSSLHGHGYSCPETRARARHMLDRVILRTFAPQANLPTPPTNITRSQRLAALSRL